MQRCIFISDECWWLQRTMKGLEVWQFHLRSDLERLSVRIALKMGISLLEKQMMFA